MSENKKVPKVYQQLVADLKSNDEKKQLSGLKKVRSKGRPEIVPALFRLYERSNSEKIKAEVQTILGELKSTETTEHLINELVSEAEETRILALSSIWSAGLDPSEYLDELVQCAINGSFMECFEVLTIFENLDTLPEEEVILNAQLMLKQYFSEDPTDEKVDLLKKIARQLQEMDALLD